MLDLTAIRMFHLDKVPDTLFSEDDERALAALVLDYAYAPTPDKPDGTRLSQEETIYLIEAFGYDVNTLHMTKRQFLMGLLPTYSMAPKHPLLVGQIFKILVDPEYHHQMLAKFQELHPTY